MNITEQLKQINSLQQEWVSNWHQNEPESTQSGLLEVVEAQHLQNYSLWHEEDIARDPKADDTEIARVKRSIDKYNQKRNDLIEKLDEFILDGLHAEGVVMNPSAPLNSETPGSMIDRCSIMALKIYHMDEQTRRTDVDQAHLELSLDKVRILRDQRADLFDCLYNLVEDIRSGFRRFKLYRQYKMYNDPTLNPQIYKTLSS